MKSILLSFVLIFLCACASQVSTIKQDRDLNLESNRGYILLGIETAHNLKSITIAGPEDIRLSHQDLRQGTNYLLVDLREGDYSIEKIQLDGYWRIELEEEKWQVQIRPGQINYVGHLELVSRGWGGYVTELVNRSSESLEFMEEKFPTILASREIIYGGPGKDFFYQTVKLLGEGK